VATRQSCIERLFATARWMRRREFLFSLAVVTVTSPSIAHGQQANHVLRVGVLMGFPENDPESKPRVEAFEQGLREVGLQVGRNVHVDYRWGTADPDQATRNAKELIDLKPNVIVGATTPGVTALLRETRTIPIVFVQVADPVEQGFIENLARPGGNITGFTSFDFSLGSKWLELLKDIAPKVARVGLIFNPDTVPYAAFVGSINAAAPSFAVRPTPMPVHGSSEIDAAISAFAQEPNGALLVLPDIHVAVHRKQVIALAAKYRLPAVSGLPYFASDGGLLSYGPDTVEQHHRAAMYVDRILKGVKPADLPVQAPTKYLLAINMKTAKALDLDVPVHLQQLADAVIE
jgi:putative tryptophan/tyrosine transport system substrate-binding protein